MASTPVLRKKNQLYQSRAIQHRIPKASAVEEEEEKSSHHPAVSMWVIGFLLVITVGSALFQMLNLA
ncbi:uncharacterized protein VTP21DRAFT_10449 [Calcarisporiella thermophila]|uniref:uncharacterized protein n=1 Tax=Calcarisporiella thermophila TaxID=911321 RepID=UPI003742D5D7